MYSRQGVYLLRAPAKKSGELPNGAPEEVPNGAPEEVPNGAPEEVLLEGAKSRITFEGNFLAATGELTVDFAIKS